MGERGEGKHDRSSDQYFTDEIFSKKWCIYDHFII